MPDLSFMNATEIYGDNIPEGQYYLPRAVAYGPDHAPEGGGGWSTTEAVARLLGGTNFRPSRDGMSVVADWPQTYWPPEGPECKCGACRYMFGPRP